MLENGMEELDCLWLTDVEYSSDIKKSELCGWETVVFEQL